MRVVKEFYLSGHESAPVLDPGRKFVSQKDEHLKLDDEQLLICGDYMPGFSLVHKGWSHFDVSNIKDIRFNAKAIDGLVLPQVKKEMISSLVGAQADES